MGNFHLSKMRTLGHLAQIIKAELVGDPQTIVRRAESFERAGEGDLTFAADKSYRARIKDSNATAVIIAPPATEASCCLLISDNPKLAFARAVQELHRQPYLPKGVSEDVSLGEGATVGEEPSIYPRVTVGENTVIGDRVTLHPGVVIGRDCRVGSDSVIYPNVSIYDGCEIGERVIVHAGTVIGADGFGFVPDEEGRQVKMLQLGRVIVEDDCEIGANCTIDRGSFGDTVLRRGVKLDNLIQLGHSCEIGEQTVIAAQTGFSGGTRTGRSCVIAGQVGSNQHVTIGDNVLVTARSGVTKDVPSRSAIAGFIAQDYNAWRRSQVLYSRLPEIVERLKRLERIISRDE
ncbi:MAG TPA: UDP-3-O-(3-hydroxymyristoyl)glucosamine N-acyltransferase [Blastocatellia bacterium]|nr:UDP-3-O-(3-hydroxymyristoyl)glucosamine N-acyltransferase [Blastocatellia bacterium]